MKYYLVLISILIFFTPVWGQHKLDGQWEGEMTYGGLVSQKEYKLELFLQVKGSKVKGRSYVYYDNETVITMDIKGKLYSDRSIYLEDIDFIPTEGVDLPPPFNRKYQLLMDRSIWVTKLEGYWQEIIVDPFHKTRDRGRISLRKVKNSKA